MKAKRKNKNSWPPEHDRFLVENYRTMSYPAIAEKLGRTASSVQARAWVLELKRTKEEQHAIALKYNKGILKKGNKCWNKGMKGLQMGGKETQFKKGGLPPNTKQDGAISIRKDKRGVPYYFIRISKGKWEHLQRVRWAEKHGSIPKGGVLMCKDGDTLNVDPGNWYLTDRKANMAKNSGAVNLPDSFVAAVLSVRQPELRQELKKHPELLEAARLSYKLRREIKKQTK